MKHIIAWCIAYIHFLRNIESQWTTIWFEDGTLNSPDEWTTTGTTEFDKSSSDGLCQTGNCVYTMSANSDWIKRQTNITQYSQLRVGYNLGVYSTVMLTYTGGSCRTYYAYGEESEKTMLTTVTPTITLSKYNENITLEEPVANTLWLWFQAENTGMMATACYWDDIHLEGIVGAQATNSPTQSPNENFTIHTEWTELWFEDGTFTDKDQWVTNQYVTYDYEATQCFTGNCVLLMYSGQMKRSTDISLYKEVRLQFDLASACTYCYAGSGGCKIFYSFDTDDESAIQQISSFDHLTGDATESRYDDEYAIFPSAIDKNTLYVWFLASGSGAAVISCFWDNIYLHGVLEDGIPEPTVHPTRAPTRAPTDVPTGNPSSAPTKAPTEQTSTPSSAPTKVPTAPTSTPSSAPTKHPTVSAPTKAPVVASNPAQSPVTQSPVTQSPVTGSVSTTDISIGDTIIEETSDLQESKAVTSEESNNFGLITLLLGIALILWIIVAVIDGKKLRPNDYFSVGSLLEAVMQILDSASDVLFAVRITNHPDFVAGSPLVTLFALSLVFIFIPIIASVVQLYLIITNEWNKNDRMRAWLRDGIYQLLMLSVVCGSSFAAVQVCSSNAFDINLFSIPLSNIDKCNFKTKRIYSMVLLENIPQLIIAIWFTVIAGFSDSNNAIVYVSMIFSAMSIFMMVLSSQTTKELLSTQENSTILLNVTGSMFGNKIKQCRKQTKAIKRNMSLLLGVDEALIEIPKPQQIHRGFRLEFILLINHSTISELDVKSKLFDADSNNVIAEFIEKCWALDALPKVEVMDFKQSESKEQQAVAMERKTNEEKAHLSTSEIQRPAVAKGALSDDNDNNNNDDEDCGGDNP